MVRTRYIQPEGHGKDNPRPAIHKGQERKTALSLTGGDSLCLRSGFFRRSVVGAWMVGIFLPFPNHCVYQTVEQRKQKGLPAQIR